MSKAPDWVTLTEGEEVVWSGHPSLATVAGSLVGGLLLVVLGVAGGVALAPPLNLGGLALVVLGLLVVGAAWLKRRSMAYVVTTEEVYAKSGILSRSVQNIRLDRAQNTGFSQSFGQRLVGIGDVHVDTAGGDEREFVLDSVPDPERVNGVITTQLDRMG